MANNAVDYIRCVPLTRLPSRVGASLAVKHLLTHIYALQMPRILKKITVCSCRCIANPFVLTQMVMIGCFRGMKDTKTPLYASLVANISNLVMDVLFVFGLHMGAGGAALATALSQMVSCSILVSLLVKKCAPSACVVDTTCAKHRVLCAKRGLYRFDTSR